MARKGILSTGPGTAPPPARPKIQPRGAVGALQSSLTRLQESAVQEIDPALIDSAGVEDRLGENAEAKKQLRESLQTYGQQVPVLLRPNPDKPGRFEIVYGRRRLAALKELGLPVKAMVRQLDDHALVMAQGQENTARQDLSFIEKASFAAQLAQADYERQTIADALSVDLPMLSRLLKVGGAFPLPFLKQIGSAPGIGRDRWLALARLFETPGAHSRATALMQTPDFLPLDSDARFEAVFQRASAKTKPKAAKPRTLRAADGSAIADIRGGSRGVTLTVSARGADGFDTWLNDNAEDLMQEIHDRWKKERS
ncbi:MAG: plasmid partitioning protein RepB [Sulfitobacter sp.]|nr:plasmid partitioning protein RepB [Sulfitobacter sp.]